MENELDIQKILAAINKSSLGVKWKKSVARWCIPCEKLRLAYKIEKDLKFDKYKISQYSHFKITEPKRRDIFAPKFIDKVVQRAMCDNGLYDDLMKDSIYDSCACQNGKGVVFAQKRLKKFLVEEFNKNGNDFWILKMDIHHFFQSIDHKRLKEIIMPKIHSEQFKRLTNEIIDSFEDPGLGLGCQVSQLMANSYLHCVDHLIKDQLGLRHYLRYCDDLIIIHKDKEVLKSAIVKINEELDKLNLRLNKKTMFCRSKNGFTFLKFKYSFTDSGKILAKADRNSVKRFQKHIFKLIKRMLFENIPKEKVWESFTSWESRMRQGTNHSIIKNLRDRIMKKMSEEEEKKFQEDRKKVISGAAEEIKIYSKLKIVKNLMGAGIWDEFWSNLSESHKTLWNNAQDFSSDYPEFHEGVMTFKKNFPGINADKILEESIQDKVSSERYPQEA